MRAPGWLPLFAVLLAAAPLAAQPSAGGTPQPSCAPGETTDFETSILKRAAVDKSLNDPLTSPSSKQVAAPAGTSNGSTLVNGADFANLLGLAFEDHLVNVADGVTTLDLNLFSFKALVSPEVLDRDSLYQHYAGVRRLGGSLSFGGKGDSFDRNGDGTADPALTAKNPGDIVKWELRYRIAGSRDRRERAADIFEAAKVDFNQSSDAFHRFFANDEVKKAIVDLQDKDHPGCYDPDIVAKYAQRPEIAAALQEIISASQKAQETITTVDKTIDQSTIWTIVVGGLDRRKEFGPSQRTASLRGARGGDDKGFTFNLDYSRIESFTSSFSERSWKLGLDYSILVLKGFKRIGKDGLKIAFSGTDELYNHVPTAAHDSVIKLNAKLDYPLTKTIHVPVSLTWANHKDLLTAERDVRGHIGFTIDLTNPGKDQ